MNILSKKVSKMTKTIAVEDSLTPIKQTLQDRGYNVTRMGDPKIDAIIVSGIDDDFMGMEDVMYNVPVINAQGKSAEDVVTELEMKL
jgi:hypothetical protein